MKTSENGKDLIKAFEGLRLEAYPDADTWAIGYGHTRGVNRGDVINERMALKYLEADIESAEEDVRNLVTVDLNQNQFDALISFIFNIGGYGTKSRPRFRESALLRKLNAGDYEGAAGEFWKWRRSGGEILTGLVRRREAERALFSRPVDDVQEIEKIAVRGDISPVPIRVERESISQSRTMRAGAGFFPTAILGTAVTKYEALADKLPHYADDVLFITAFALVAMMMLFRLDDHLKARG